MMPDFPASEQPIEMTNLQRAFTRHAWEELFAMMPKAATGIMKYDSD